MTMMGVAWKVTGPSLPVTTGNGDELGLAESLHKVIVYRSARVTHKLSEPSISKWFGDQDLAMSLATRFALALPLNSYARVFSYSATTTTKFPY
jgi:hypothetical protein